MDDRDGSDPPAVHPRTQDALLDHYAEMRADIRTHDRRKSRRLLQAIVALAAVLALAYVGRPWVVSAVPVVLTFLFLAHVAAENRAFRRTRSVAAVERLLDAPGVGYEREYGALSAHASRLHDRIPLYALAGCFFVAWGGSIAVGLAAFHRSPPTLLGGPVSVAVPAAVYLVLVGLVTLATWSYLATRSEHRAADAPPADAPAGDATETDAFDRDQRRLDDFAAADELAGDDESAEDAEPDDSDSGDAAPATDADPATDGEAAADGDAAADAEPTTGNGTTPDAEPTPGDEAAADEPMADGEAAADGESGDDAEPTGGAESTVEDESADDIGPDGPADAT